MRENRGKKGLGIKGNIFPRFSFAALSFPILFLPLFLALTACGFTPVYGSHESNNAHVAGELNQIAIDNIPDHNGQMLRNDLIDRMYGKGRPGTPLYTLSVHMHYTVEDLGIQADATSTRSLMNMYGDFKLSDANHNVVLSGTAHSVTSFNKLANQYGTLAAEQSSFERTIFEVSEQIVNRLSLFMAERPDPATQPQLPKEPEATTVVIPNASETVNLTGIKPKDPKTVSSPNPVSNSAVPPTQLPPTDGTAPQSANQTLPVVSPSTDTMQPSITAPTPSTPTLSAPSAPSAPSPPDAMPSMMRQTPPSSGSPNSYPPVNFGVP
jgi:LPS-assembly lipoprotein